MDINNINLELALLGERLEGESEFDFFCRVTGIDDELGLAPINPRQVPRRREIPRLHRRSRYVKENPLPAQALEWFDRQFGENSFDGWFHLGYRRQGTSEIWPLFKGNREKVREFLQGFNVHGKIDFYITANATKTGSERKGENLFSIHNIVIDIDNHAADQTYMRPLHQKLADTITRDLYELPPSSIVYTGRGIQLWWSIIPVAKACEVWVKEIRETLISAVEEIISEYPDFEDFTVDHAASSNNVGYYRLPGTVNTHTGRVVTVESTPARYDTHEMIKWAKAWQEERRPIEPEPKLLDFSGSYSEDEIGIFRGVKTSAFYRVRQIVQLRILRDRDVGSETRNNMNFIFFNALLPVLGPGEAWDKLVAFNKGFKVPMTEVELHRTVDTSIDKGGYRYRNDTMISFLAVTPEEQQQIGLYPVDSPNHKLLKDGLSHSGARAMARTIKDDRNAKIKALAYEGKSKSEIATILGINRGTVQSVLGTGSIKAADMKSLFEAGLTPKQVSEKLMLPIRTVRRHYQKMAKLNKDTLLEKSL